MLLGVALLQVAWLVSMPPFRGSDEVDHVFRASAVAQGDWSSSPTAATRGTGALVGATPAMVEAASNACTRLEYKDADDCRLVPTQTGPAVASGAGRYNPAYYVAVGYASAAVDGVTGSYLMRGVSALLCLVLLGATLEGLLRWADARVLAASAMALTPTVIYSTVIVAPNGLELMAGLLLWSSLAGLAHGTSRAPFHVATGTVALSILLVLRSLGPLWAAGILVTALVAWPHLARRLLCLGRSLRALAVLAFVAGAGAAGVTWTLTHHSLTMSQDGPGGSLSLGYRVGRALQEVPLWLLQDVGAFPFRNQPAPLVVYPVFLLLAIALARVAFRRATGRLHAAVALVALAGVGIPLVITVVMMAEIGTAWQGRYAMPLLVGVGLLLGLAWSDGPSRSVSTWTSLVLCAAVVAVHVPGPVKVAWDLRDTSDWVVGSEVIQHAPVWLVGLLAAAGSLLAAWPLCRELARPGAVDRGWGAHRTGG